MPLRAVWLLSLAVSLAGCTLFPGDGDITDAPPAPATQPTPGLGPPLAFGGRIVDALTGEPVADASVRLDLAQTLPCGRQGIGWTSWDAPVANGSWGPVEVARPRSSDVAFFLHAKAPGYGENSTFIGPTQAKGDIRNLSVVMHPDAAVEGSAPPGTVLALDAPSFPRVAVAGAEGAFRFPQARAVDATLVAGTDTPWTVLVRAPANVTVPPSARGWMLEGIVKGPSGAPLAADVVAWNGTRLVSVARAGENGVFALPLPPQPMAFRVEARTPDNHYGGTRPLVIEGPPALRETVLMNALC